MQLNLDAGSADARVGLSGVPNSNEVSACFFSHLKPLLIVKSDLPPSFKSDGLILKFIDFKAEVSNASLYR
jgi:hypothetical protein